jgi:hypothetical protein
LMKLLPMRSNSLWWLSIFILQIDKEHHFQPSWADSNSDSQVKEERKQE